MPPERKSYGVRVMECSLRLASPAKRPESITPHLLFYEILT